MSFLSNRDLVKLSHQSSLKSFDPYTVLLSILSLPLKQREKPYLKLILPILESQDRCFFSKKLNSDNIAYDLLQNLILKRITANEIVNFKTAGVLILISGVFQIEETIYQVDCSEQNFKYNIMIGKITKNGFICPANDDFFANPRKTADVLAIKEGFIAYLSNEKYQWIYHHHQSQNLKESIVRLSKAPFLKAASKKTLCFLLNKLFIERKFPLGSVLPSEGVYFIRSGSLELMKKEISEKVNFKIANLLEGEICGFLEEKPLLENLNLRSKSNDTIVYFITKQGIRLLEVFDINTFVNLKESLRKNEKIHKERFEELLKKYKEWKETKIPLANTKEPDLIQRISSHTRIPSFLSIASNMELPKMKEKLLKSKSKSLVDLPNILSLQNLPDMVEITSINKKNIENESNENFMVRNLRSKIKRYPLSIHSTKKGTIQRLFITIKSQITYNKGFN